MPTHTPHLALLLLSFLPSSALAGSAPWVVTVTASVQNVCIVQQQTPQHLTLLCTRGYVPAQPQAWAVPDGRTWSLASVGVSPEGGTLNEYVPVAQALQGTPPVTEPLALVYF